MIQQAATVPLATERFSLRALRRSDAAARLPTLGDEAQCRYLTRPAFTSEDELWGWLADPDWPGQTWIAEDARGEICGRFVAIPQAQEGLVEIGYITCIGWQRRGVARECMEALIAHLFCEGRAQRLRAEVDIENAASLRLLDRLGFAREALHRNYEETHKGMCDVAIYGLDRAAYRVQSGASDR